MLYKKPYRLTRVAVLTLTLMTIFVVSLASLSFSEEIYANKKGHFSLALPNGWGVISDEAMKSFNEGKEVKFDAGFHKNMQEYPYILMEIDTRGKTAIEEMRQAINISRSEDGIKNILNELKNLKPEQSVYDKKRSMIFVKYAMNAGDGRRILYLQHMVLSNYGAIYIYYYALEENFNNNLGDFEKIIDSFRLEDGFKCTDLANYSTGSTLSDYDKAIERNPKDASVYSERGKILFDDYNNFDQAMSDFNKAIELSPDNGKYYFNRGLLYDTKGNFEAALKDYTKAIELIPNYPDAYNNRGAVYLALGDVEKSISDYSKSIQLNPNNTKAYTGRGAVYIQKGDVQNGMLDLNKAIELSPTNADAYANRANAYANLKNNNEAISDLNKAIELNPNVANAHYSLGIIYGSIGKLDEAISEYSRELKVNPNHFYALENRAVTYFYKKEYDNSWKDVNELRARGYNVKPTFIEDLKKASGRQK